MNEQTAPSSKARETEGGRDAWGEMKAGRGEGEGRESAVGRKRGRLE